VLARTPPDPEERNAREVAEVEPGSNLPAARVVLYGRSASIEELARRIQTPSGRLATITGPGGVGKTSLAQAVARQLLLELRHGAWFVDLSALATPRAVPHAVAAAVGVRESSTTNIEDSLRAFLRDRELLLVVDNCEHVLEACAALLDDLLDQAPGLRVLATSREPLRLRGELLYPLAPLPVPIDAPERGVDRLLEFASVQLFVDRARAVRPDLQISDHNARTIAEICRRLDGIPLALELAATRAGGLTLDYIAERLNGSFEVLIRGGRSGPARHQTLRATLEWSHQLLSPIEQSIFADLGAFAGGWTMAAAQAVCASERVDESEVADVIARLVDKSLIVFEEADGEARYRFLEPVREYAQGRLAASANSGAPRDRHCAYYLAFAELVEPEIHRARQAVWMRRLDRDLDNLRLAVRTARARTDAESVLRLAGALWWYLWMRGHLTEGLEWVDGLLDAPQLPPAARLAGLRVSAMLLGSLGRSTQALTNAAELLDLAERTGDIAEAARAATLLGLEEVRAAHIDRAQPLMERALADARSVNHPMLLPHALVNLGAILFEIGEPLRAKDLYSEALAEFERHGDVWGIAYATNHLAAVARQRSAHLEAVQLSAESARLLLSLGDRFYLILAVEDLARARIVARQYRSAARLLGSAHALRTASGALLSPFSQAENERDLARVRTELGGVDFEQAWAQASDHPLEVLVNETDSTVPAKLSSAVDTLGGPGGVLTAREREVVRLIALGYSNRQIAEELVVTAGTAGIHVEHILRKLDLRSRHQVSDWARARGLLSD
jgi:non-specific serine/threonine protein kinase